MQLMERDYKILKEISRWRYCQSKHIQILCGFNTQQVLDRRLQKLRQGGYIEYQRPLFGCAGLYTLAHKGKVLIGANKRQEKIRIDQIPHDIAVLDTACYFITKQGIPLEAITTERQLRSLDGFGTRNHKADFIFTKSGKSIAVEVELNPKTKDRFLKNIKQNYLNHDAQIWIIPKDKPKILKLLAEVKRSYDSVELLYLEGIYEP